MIFDSLHQAKEWFLQYKLMDLKLKITDFWTEYGWQQWRFGDYILIQHIKEGRMISRPILAVFTGFNVWDQALVVEFVQGRRAWMNSNYIRYHYGKLKGESPVSMFDIRAEQIQFWTDNIKVLGHWKHRPSIKDLKQALKNKI